MPTIYKEVEVDVELDDFTDNELLDELERRDLITTDTFKVKEHINIMYEKFRQGKNIDEELHDFFWMSIGRHV
jgi:hypothetical protein